LIPPAVGASSRRGWRGRQGAAGVNLPVRGQNPQNASGAARRDKTLAAPCRLVEILAGSAASLASLSDGSTVAGRRKSATRSRF